MLSSAPPHVRHRLRRHDRSTEKTIAADRLPARRRAGGPHPSGGEALRARVLSERGRIARLSPIRELVLGFQDGLLVPFGVVTGLAGVSVGTKAIIVGSVAEAVPRAAEGDLHRLLPLRLFHSEARGFHR